MPALKEVRRSNNDIPCGFGGGDAWSQHHPLRVGRPGGECCACRSAIVWRDEHARRMGGSGGGRSGALPSIGRDVGFMFARRLSFE
jgi:hypothetical protein